MIVMKCECFWPMVQSDCCPAPQCSDTTDEHITASCVGSACEVKRGNIFTVEEVDQMGKVILYAAGWRTWSQMLSDPVCGSNKMGIRCNFELPWRMPSRYASIWCCLRHRTCRTATDQSCLPSKTLPTATAPICVMSHWSILSGSHTYSVLASLGCPVMWGISTNQLKYWVMRSKKLDWMEALQQLLWPIRFLHSAGTLFAF